MSATIISRDEVARRLAVPKRRLGALRSARPGARRQGRRNRGIRAGRDSRIWAIVSYQRDLGINLAGVEAILKLCADLSDVHQRLDTLAHLLNEALDESPDHPDA